MAKKQTPRKPAIRKPAISKAELVRRIEELKAKEAKLEVAIVTGSMFIGLIIGQLLYKKEPTTAVSKLELPPWMKRS